VVIPRCAVLIGIVLGARVPAIHGKYTMKERQSVCSYRELEVSYENATDTITLAGTLTFPDTEQLCPAVVLIAGYGPQDRNATGMGHQYFSVLADHLAQQGIASLRFDKRGVGQSSGSLAMTTSEDLARDVLAGIAYLKTRSEVDAHKVGLVGLSEGGLIAALVASESSDVAYAVLMAPALATKPEDMLYNTALQLRADGASEEFIEDDQKVRCAVYGLAQEYAQDSKESMQEAMRAEIEKYVQALSESHKLEAQKLPFAFTETKIESIVAVLSSSAYQFFLTHDSLPVLERITIPLLTIIGDRDYIASAARVFPLVEKASAKSGNQDCHRVELPQLNHMFQTCVTGSLAEYGSIKETMSPVALYTISDWIREHTKSIA
jgi:uncharacterized protein